MSTNKWIVKPRQPVSHASGQPEPALRLFCFPPAGAWCSASGTCAVMSSKLINSFLRGKTRHAWCTVVSYFVVEQILQFLRPRWCGLELPAGAGAGCFHTWSPHLPATVEVMPVELPGHASRMQEAPNFEMQELVAALIVGLGGLLRDKPFALFGHSMGSWIAYELCQELQRRDAMLPVKIYVSGSRAPGLPDVDPVRLHSLPYADFWAHFDRRYGHNPSLAEPSFRKFIHPQLQADLTLVETYQPVNAEPLPIPIAAIGAKDDNRYTPDQLAAWRSHTSRAFQELWVDGGHSYIFERPRQLLDFLSLDVQCLL